MWMKDIENKVEHDFLNFNFDINKTYYLKNNNSIKFKKIHIIKFFIKRY